MLAKLYKITKKPTLHPISFRAHATKLPPTPFPLTANGIIYRGCLSTLLSGGPTVAALAMAMPPKGHIAAVCMTTTRREIWENVKIELISVRIM